MIATLLMGLLADLVFGAASSTGRSCRNEFNRYLTERGFGTPAGPAKPSTK
jgi:hypothetical protein